MHKLIRVYNCYLCKKCKGVLLTLLLLRIQQNTLTEQFYSGEMPTLAINPSENQLDQYMGGSVATL